MENEATSIRNVESDSQYFVLAGNVSFEIPFFTTFALCGRITARTAAIFMQHDVHTIIQKGCKQLNLSTIAKGVMDAWIRLRFGFSSRVWVGFPPKP